MKRYLFGTPITLLFIEAFESLEDNRFRTILSLLGVAIGIASIIVVSSIATSGKDMVFRELETFGLRSFWIYRTTATDEALEKNISGTGINTADYKELLRQNLPSIANLSPVIELNTGHVMATKSARSIKIRLQGVSQNFNQINGDKVSLGRFLSARDVEYRLDVAVIGPGVVEKLFPKGEPVLGQKISIGDNWFQIIGVLERKSRDLISSLGAGGEETSARIIIPYTTRQKLIADNDFVSYIQGQSSELNRTNEAINAVIRVLNLRHRNAFHYKGESMSTYVTTANNILGGVSLIGIAAAAISLLVGGLAIMNIMTTSVIERTREIGLRRAIGASQIAIRTQFIMESVLISSIGGVMGILLGLGIIRMAPIYSSVLIDINYYGVLLAMLSTFFVGIVSGYYPALTASKLEPVEALRHD